MARPTRPTRPEKKEPENFIGYFNRIDANTIKVVAAAFSNNSKNHVIICAPNEAELKDFWDSISTTPIDKDLTQVLLCRYDEQIVQFEAELDVQRSKVSPVIHTKDARPWLWFHHESGSCFIEEECFIGDGLADSIGEAVECTVEECKRLLREHKQTRSYIESVSINPSTDSLLPF